jgi:hypothetical protein
VWVSQSNHIPMEIEEDKERPWLPLQVIAFSRPCLIAPACSVMHCFMMMSLLLSCFTLFNCLSVLCIVVCNM